MRRAALIVQQIERWILTSAVLAMAANTIVNVFARNLFGQNLAASQELNEFLIIIVCFAGLSYAASQGRHIRMTAIYDQLSDRYRRLLMIFISATTAALLFTLAWFGASYAGSVDRISPVLGIPLRIVYAIVPLGLTLGGIQYVLTLWRNLRSDEPYLSFDHPDRHIEVDTEGGG